MFIAQVLVVELMEILERQENGRATGGGGSGSARGRGSSGSGGSGTSYSGGSGGGAGYDYSGTSGSNIGGAGGIGYLRGGEIKSSGRTEQEIQEEEAKEMVLMGLVEL